MRCCIIFNPAARGEKAARLRRQLDAFTAQCTCKLTSAPGSARALAAEAVTEGFDTVVSAGGDGTINEVLNGIGDAPDGFACARLGVLPLGTVNVFAKELGLPTNLDKAWAIIRQGKESRIDLPRADFTDNGKAAHRYFVQLGGAGLDARAIKLVNWALKKKIGPLAYVVAGLQAINSPHATVEINGEGVSAAGQLVLLGNGRYYGGRFHIFPRADLRDGLLDVTVFPKVNWPAVIHCGSWLLTARSLPSRRAKHFRAASIRLSAASTTPFELDGELIGNLPATVSVERERLRVIVP